MLIDEDFLLRKASIKFRGALKRQPADIKYYNHA